MSVRFAKPYQIVDNQNWTAIKYPDGRSECYRLVPVVNLQTSMEASGGIYYGRISSYGFPTGLFIDTPVLEATFLSGDGYLAFVFGVTGTTATSAGAVELGRGDNATLNGYVSLRAIGRWK